MSFQPFGFRFDIVSSMSPADAKAAIRKRKKAWFEPKGGARGWIVGPVICLWASAINEQGPMLVGWVSDNGLVTRITGRAGSDLNGMLWLLVLLSVTFPILLSQDITSGSMLLTGALVAFAVFVLWLKHISRKEAEPLVRFLQDAVSKSGKTARRPHVSTAAFPRTLTLDVNGDLTAAPLTAQAIYAALLDLGEGEFAILSAGDEHYIQTGCENGAAFMLERRDGDYLHHFRAQQEGRDQVPFDAVVAAFMAYADGAPMPAGLNWKKVDMPPNPA